MVVRVSCELCRRVFREWVWVQTRVKEYGKGVVGKVVLAVEYDAYIVIKGQNKGRLWLRETVSYAKEYWEDNARVKREVRES